MEHTPILPKGAPLPAGMIDTLAMQGLQSLLHAPIAKVARVFADFDREQISAAVEIMVALLDATDGDPDLENATDLEDDFALSPIAAGFGADGPGCSIADTDAGAYVEWHTKPANLRRNGQAEILPGHEDDEDDDPAEEDDDSGDNAYEDEPAGYMPTRWGYGPGCPISDPGGGEHEGGDEIYRTPPRYGVDQSLGPINEVEAIRREREAMFAR